MNGACHLRIADAGRLRDVFASAFRTAAQLISSAGALELIVRPVKSKRSLEQNALMWALLTDVSEQIEWEVDGRLTKLAPDDWKDLFTAAHRREMRVARGIEGGIVLLGARTSRMTVQQMTELVELIFAFGSERGVRWSASDKHIPEEWRAFA